MDANLHVDHTGPGGSRRARVGFRRGRHRWTFECDAAGEAEMLRWIAWCAEHPSYAIDRFDAAVITRQFLSRIEEPALKPKVRKAD